MIVKELVMPNKVKKLEALLRRLPRDHPKRQEIESDYAKSLAGYRGEQSLDYFFSFLSEEYLVFHDVRLSDRKHFFQLDVLILSPYFFLIAEVKNFSGAVIFDEKHQQFIRVQDTAVEAFPDPLAQVRHQQMQFNRWLKMNKCPQAPVEAIVVITNPQTIIKTISDHPSSLDKIVRNANLLEKIESLRKLYKDKKLTSEELRKLGKRLLKHHTPQKVDVLARYQIARSDLLMGVHCPNCRSLPMKRRQGIWVCPTCLFSSKDAHIAALKDYVLLLQPEITNQQLKEFLQIQSSASAHHILMTMNLPHTGKTKGRKYLLPLDE